MRLRHLLIIIFIVSIFLRGGFILLSDTSYNLRLYPLDNDIYNLNAHRFNLEERTWIRVTPDTTGFIGCAEGMIKVLFTKNEPHFLQKQRMAFRTPVFPIFVYLIYAGFGELFFVFLQAIIDSVSSCLIFLIAWQLFHRKTPAFMAGLFYAVFPPGILLSTYLLSETLSGFLFLLFVCYFILALNSKSYTLIAISGALLAIATLSRPVFIYFYIISSGFILFYRATKQDKKWIDRKNLKKVFLFLFIFFLFLIPWQFFQYKVNGHFEVTAIDEFNLCGFNALDFMVGSQGYSYKEANEYLSCGWDGVNFNGYENIFDETRRESKIAVKYILGHFPDYIQFCFERYGDFFVFSFSQPFSELFRDLTSHNINWKSLVRISYLFYIITVPLILFGFYRLYCDKKFLPFFLILITILYLLFINQLQTYYKYFSAIWPFYMIIASYGGFMVYKRFFKS